MLCVRDVAQSRRFYVDGLGASLLSEEDHVVMVRLAGTVLYLFSESPPTSDKPGVHLAPPAPDASPSVVVVLRVDDAGSAHRELTRRGVEFLTPPAEPPWGGLRCFARDPDGYVVEVEQAP